MKAFAFVTNGNIGNINIPHAWGFVLTGYGKEMGDLLVKDLVPKLNVETSISTFVNLVAENDSNFVEATRELNKIGGDCFIVVAQKFGKPNLMFRVMDAVWFTDFFVTFCDNVTAVKELDFYKAYIEAAKMDNGHLDAFKFFDEYNINE